MRSLKSTTSSWISDPPAGAVPLLDALLRAAEEKPARFQMPAHQGGTLFPDSFRLHLADIDWTEGPDTGDLLHPAGPVRAALDAAARAFGAGSTRFVTGGSTSALFALLHAVVPRGGTFLAGRASHRSVLAAAELFGLTAIPVSQPGPNPHTPPGSCPASPIPPMSAGELEAALARHPEACAVLATSPDYYGTTADIAALARLVHARGRVLLVDEAHGAHLAFAPPECQAPPPALSQGADGVVHSAHKTLPALTPGALVHLGSEALRLGRVRQEDLDHSLRMVSTSSPPFPVAASIDYARWYMETHGPDSLRALSEGARRLASRLEGLPIRLRTPGAGDVAPALPDPFRLVLALEPAAPFPDAGALAAALQRRGLRVEMADFRRLVLIPPLADPDTVLQALGLLADALLSAFRDASVHPGPDRDRSREALQEAFRLDGLLCGRMAVGPETGPGGMHGPGGPVPAGSGSAWVAPGEAEGRRTAVPLIPLPPGVPVAWPGERLDAQLLRLLGELGARGWTLSGPRDRDGALRVLAEPVAGL